MWRAHAIKCCRKGSLGRTGLTVSKIGVGGAQCGLQNDMGAFDPYTDEAQQATTATVHRALELGYTYFDSAPGYGDGRVMRPLTSGVFQRLMAEAFPEIDVLDVGRLLLNYVLSDPYVDVALVGGHGTCLGEPRLVELNNAISDDVASRIDLAALHDRYVP